MAKAQEVTFASMVAFLAANETFGVEGFVAPLGKSTLRHIPVQRAVRNAILDSRKPKTEAGEAGQRVKRNMTYVLVGQDGEVYASETCRNIGSEKCLAHGALEAAADCDGLDDGWRILAVSETATGISVDVSSAEELFALFGVVLAEEPEDETTGDSRDVLDEMC